MANQNRHRAGTPIGGRYAPGRRAAADASVQLDDAHEQANQRMRTAVMKAAGTLTGHGTISANEQLAQMTDQRVATVHADLLDAFHRATTKAAGQRLDSPRERLANVIGPMLGTGTSGARERMGAMSDADVEALLVELGEVWDEATPAAPDLTDDPWGEVRTPNESPNGRALHSTEELEDIRKGDAFVHDGRLFQRRREGVYPNEPYAIAVRLSAPVDDGELSQIAGLTGYAYSTTGGERAYGDPERVDERTFILHVDTTKGRAYRKLDRFEDMLADTITEGSPVRTTNRSGPGTQGTRLVEGVGKNLAPEVFYDSVNRNDG